MTIGIDARLWSQTGVGRYIQNLVKNLVQIDSENLYTIFARSEDKGEIKSITKGKWKIIESNIRWHSLSEQTLFAKILQKENLDLIHFPYFSAPVIYNKPFVITIHDLIINHFATGKSTTLPLPLYKIKLEAYKMIVSKLAGNAVKIITPSIATKQEIIDHLGVDSEKIVVTHEGSDLKTSSKEKIIKGRYFLYVGNAYPHKNLDFLLSVFSEIDAKLVLVGKEDFFYKRLKSKNKLSNIVFFGEATEDELSSLYSNTTALIAPSLMEGFGLPVLEAMSLRIPVIASKIPAFEEVIGNSGVYFDPEDKEDLIQKIKEITNDPMTKERVERAYQRSKEFSWEKMAKETLKVYESSISL